MVSIKIQVIVFNKKLLYYELWTHNICYLPNIFLPCFKNSLLNLLQYNNNDNNFNFSNLPPHVQKIFWKTNNEKKKCNNHFNNI